MNLLGLDFGQKKIGIALATGLLAGPLEVFRYKSPDHLITHIKDLINKYSIDAVVIGLSENQMEKSSEEFGKMLTSFDIKVFYQDETLSTQDAISLSIEAGIGRKKRKNMEDAYAATIMLQDYIDNLK
jgi:putative holliday junction resolvase